MSVSTVACNITAYRDGAKIMIALQGALRLGNSEAVKNQIIKLSEGCETVNLHVGQLTELDSAGLGVIVGVHMLTRNRKQQFNVLAPTPFVLRLFESTRLTSVLHIISGTDAVILRAQFARPELAIAAEELSAA